MIGIVESCTAVIPFISRTSNRDSKRRELTIVDEDTTMSMTLWDEQVRSMEIFESETIQRNSFRRRISMKNVRRERMSLLFIVFVLQSSTTVRETSKSLFHRNDEREFRI